MCVKVQMFVASTYTIMPSTTYFSIIQITDRFRNHSKNTFESKDLIRTEIDNLDEILLLNLVYI